MKHTPKKPLRLARETMRRLVPAELTGVHGGITWTTVIFSEGHCETYSWARSCAPAK